MLCASVLDILARIFSVHILLYFGVRAPLSARDAQADKLEMYNIFESSLVSYSKLDEEEPRQLASLSD